MTKQTDYGIVLLTYFARAERDKTYTARDLATATNLAQPTVSKTLKPLARAGILDSHRGAKGGYSLARRPEEITVADIVSALEGPLAITACISDEQPECDRFEICGVRNNWERVNHMILNALRTITLADMSVPMRRAPDGAEVAAVHFKTNRQKTA